MKSVLYILMKRLVESDLLSELWRKDLGIADLSEGEYTYFVQNFQIHVKGE